jgi:hypothetical protein
MNELIIIVFIAATKSVIHVSEFYSNITKGSI